jgi:arylsulfatase A-like enzyme
MNRREFLTLAGGCMVAANAAPRKPNVIVIVADDLGWADLGVQGCKDIPTPNIDSIARNGARCTTGYVTCPVCSPTRAGLMTGRYQQRFGHEFNPGPAAEASPEFGLPLDQTTLANRLKTRGYVTGIVGKWHLGYRPEFHPMRRGFDEFFGFLGGAHRYDDALADEANPIYKGTKQVDEKEYLTDAFAREALSFVDRRKNNPFFLYWTFNAVHAPMFNPEKYSKRFADTIPDAKRRTFAGMLTAMDEAVGRMLTKLREYKLENDTLIVFLSDNGGPTRVNTSSNAPLRGVKATVWEGGIRVPYLVQWRGTIKPNTVIDHAVSSLDIVPTVVAAAGGGETKGVDGVDLLPLLTGKSKVAPHPVLYWRHGEQKAIRKGSWKLVKNAKQDWQLFQLQSDAGEQHNLAGSMGEKREELEADYEAWEKQLEQPRWKAPGEV